MLHDQPVPVSGGKELAADIKDTRMPHPHLSNLEEGVYTFTLKVTDAKGQSDEDQVRSDFSETPD